MKKMLALLLIITITGCGGGGSKCPGDAPLECSTGGCCPRGYPYDCGNGLCYQFGCPAGSPEIGICEFGKMAPSNGSVTKPQAPIVAESEAGGSVLQSDPE